MLKEPIKVIVTGADGYLGRGIVEKLLDYGCDVSAVGLNTRCVDERAKKKDIDIFLCEDPFFGFGKPDVVIHLAWRDGFVHNSRAHIEDFPMHCAYVDKLAKGDLDKLCVMGSMHEIGYHEGVVRADTPCEPLSLYGIAKNALRQYCQLTLKHTSTSLLWLRGFYIVSADPSGNSIFSKIAKAELEGKKTFPLTSGMNAFDFLDYSTFCEYVARVAIHEKALGTINVCSGEPVTLKDRVERFIAENGYDIQLEYGAYPDRPYDSPAIWGDNTQLISLIGEALEC